MTIKNNKGKEGRLGRELIKLNLEPGPPYSRMWWVNFYRVGKESLGVCASA